MPFITQGKTNLKYILIVVILAVIVGGGILARQYLLIPKEESKIPEVELPKVEAPEEEVEVPEEIETPEELIEEEFLETPEKLSLDCTFPTELSDALLFKLEQLGTYSLVTVVPSDFSNWPSLMTGQPIQVHSGVAGEYVDAIKQSEVILEVIITEYSEESMEEFEFYRNLILSNKDKKIIFGIPVFIYLEPPVQNGFSTVGSSSIVALVPDTQIIITFSFDPYQEQVETIFSDWLRTICVE